MSEGSSIKATEQAQSPLFLTGSEQQNSYQNIATQIASLKPEQAELLARSVVLPNVNTTVEENSFFNSAFSSLGWLNRAAQTIQQVMPDKPVNLDFLLYAISNRIVDFRNNPSDPLLSEKVLGILDSAIYSITDEAQQGHYANYIYMLRSEISIQNEARKTIERLKIQQVRASSSLPISTAVPETAATVPSAQPASSSWFEKIIALGKEKIGNAANVNSNFISSVFSSASSVIAKSKDVIFQKFSRIDDKVEELKKSSSNAINNAVTAIVGQNLNQRELRLMLFNDKIYSGIVYLDRKGNPYPKRFERREDGRIQELPVTLLNPLYNLADGVLSTFLYQYINEEELEYVILEDNDSSYENIRILKLFDQEIFMNTEYVKTPYYCCRSKWQSEREEDLVDAHFNILIFTLSAAVGSLFTAYNYDEITKFIANFPSNPQVQTFVHSVLGR